MSNVFLTVIIFTCMPHVQRWEVDGKACVLSLSVYLFNLFVWYDHHYEDGILLSVALNI